MFWLILPTANVGVMNIFLREYAGTLPEDVLVVMLANGAGWHTSKKLRVPPKIYLVVLPPYTPELNPAERLWHLVRESTSNTGFSSLQQLEDALCQRCLELDAQPQFIASTTSYHGYAP